MSIRNRPRKDPNFDLDNYLIEKSNEEFDSETTDHQEEKKSSGFFRNASLVVAAVLASVLWYYDWSPSNVYAAIFGGPETNAVVLESAGGENILVLPPADASGEIVIVDGGNGENILVLPPSVEETPIIINSESIAALEQAAVEFATSEEIERLTEESIALALDAAFAALEGIQGVEGIEGLESLEALEGLEELGQLAEVAAIEALNNIDFSEIQIETGQTNISDFDRYSRELSALNINQFDGESIRSLHEAGIPVSFLSRLNQVGLLDRLDADEIIDLFEEN